MNTESFLPGKEPNKRRKPNSSVTIWIAMLVVLIGFGTWGMIVYTKYQAKSGTANQSMPAGSSSNMVGTGNSNTGGCTQSGDCSGSSSSHAPIVGTVTAIDADSITIKVDSTGSSKTYGTTSSTAELDVSTSSQTTYDWNDISVGETVGIAEDLKNATTAEVVMPHYKAITGSTSQQ
jgi:cytoskeletal protein RodZ